MDRMQREFDEFVREPGPNDRVALGNPPINLPQGRKDTRHKDAQGTEGGGKRKAPRDGTEAGGGNKKNEVGRWSQLNRFECSMRFLCRAVVVGVENTWLLVGCWWVDDVL